MSDSAPPFQLALVEGDTTTAASQDEHPSRDQLIPDMGGWAGVPRPGSHAPSFGENDVPALGGEAPSRMGPCLTN
jgi:hypothetical protein